jgi:hypothetical protein
MASNPKKKTKSAVPAGKLKQLARRYKNALDAAAAGGNEHLTLARELYELAIKSPDAHLMTVEQTFERGTKPVQRHYPLSDPRAALLLMLRFCNIWLPIPLLVCMARGCPAFRPPIPPAIFGCFLISCAVNVCPVPGAPRFMCVYLCI